MIDCLSKGACVGNGQDLTAWLRMFNVQHTIRLNMKAIGKFFKNGWLLILLVLSFAAAGYSFYLHWHNPQQLQNVGVIASFAIAGLLALVTWQYARATEKTL